MIVPPGETIVETKKCRISGQEFFVTDKDLEFYDKVSPVFDGKKYSIPTPTLCPEERMRLIMSYINQRYLYKNNSCFTGKEVISNFGPHSSFTVCSTEEWHGDGWNPQDYKKNITFDRPFFSQFRDFIIRVPHWALNQGSNENSEYANYGARNNSCYLLLTGSDNTHVYYSSFVYKSIDCMDCEYIKEGELCYGCTDIQKCYSLFWCQDCINCSNGYFMKNCTSCQNCFGCCNLIGKIFHIFNRDVGEGKYREFITAYFSLTLEKKEVIKKDVMALWQGSIQLYIHGFSNENVSGDFIYNSKNIWRGFEIKNAQNIKNSISLDNTTDTYDCIMSRNSEWNYYSSLASNHSSYVAFSTSIVGEGSRIYYSDTCIGISDCFACSGFHSHEHHCILNRPYSLHEYEQLCGKIIDHMISTGEWGEFFPHELSPFGYNETIAQEYFPMTEAEVKVKGWNWYTEPTTTFEGTSIIPLPISEYDEKVIGYEIAQRNIDELLQGVIRCEVTGKLFKIIKQELAFYIEHHLPIPRKHPDQRHCERLFLRNKRNLHERPCTDCGKTIITTYAPQSSEKVLCEECYRKIVY